MESMSVTVGGFRGVIQNNGGTKFHMLLDALDTFLVSTRPYLSNMRQDM